LNPTLLEQWLSDLPPLRSDTSIAAINELLRELSQTLPPQSADPKVFSKLFRALDRIGRELIDIAQTGETATGRPRGEPIVVALHQALRTAADMLAFICGASAVNARVNAQSKRICAVAADRALTLLALSGLMPCSAESQQSAPQAVAITRVYEMVSEIGVLHEQLPGFATSAKSSPFDALRFAITLNILGTPDTEKPFTSVDTLRKLAARTQLTTKPPATATSTSYMVVPDSGTPIRPWQAVNADDNGHVLYCEMSSLLRTCTQGLSKSNSVLGGEQREIMQWVRTVLSAGAAPRSTPSVATEDGSSRDRTIHRLLAGGAHYLRDALQHPGDTMQIRLKGPDGEYPIHLDTWLLTTSSDGYLLHQAALGDVDVAAGELIGITRGEDPNKATLQLALVSHNETDPHGKHMLRIKPLAKAAVPAICRQLVGEPAIDEACLYIPAKLGPSNRACLIAPTTESTWSGKQAFLELEKLSRLSTIGEVLEASGSVVLYQLSR
jgi:hypothetical protein